MLFTQKDRYNEWKEKKAEVLWKDIGREPFTMAMQKILCNSTAVSLLQCHSLTNTFVDNACQVFVLQCSRDSFFVGELFIDSILRGMCSRFDANKKFESFR